MLAFYWAFTLIFWLVFIISFKADRSRYINCIFLGLAILVTVPAICFLTGDYANRAIYICGLIFGIFLLLVPIAFTWNGIIMIRREGIKISNILSLVLGLAVGIGEVATTIAMFGVENEAGTAREHLAPLAQSLLSVLSITIIYFSVCMLLFMLYSIFLGIIPHRKNYDYVVIHGAGLIGGSRVSKLLADRINKAIKVYNRCEVPPVMIPSGGKGSDEDISEAEAMAGYLREHGIPDDHIILEDQSATTYENVKNSKAIIEGREGEKRTALVTSNYHVYRTLRYARALGFKCTGIGSHVALYYWPSAVIREFIAVNSEKRHLITMIAGLLLLLAMATRISIG